MPASHPAELLFQVKGLDCADCAAHLEEALLRIDGVAEVALNFSLARLRVVPQDGMNVRARVEQVAQSMGYDLCSETARRADDDLPPPTCWRERLWHRRRELATALSGLLIVLAFGLSLSGLAPGQGAVFYVAAIVVGGFFTARAGWASLRAARSLDMNALMTIAAAGAVLVGEWAEGAVAMFLFSLGNTLESHTMARARHTIQSLMTLSPRQATVMREGREERAPVEALHIGDVVRVRPGERIPADGQVVSGQSAVNQAPITGESVPVDKSPGERVFAGTVNGQGALTLRVSRLAADTTLARIIQMVEQAQAQRSPTQRFVDRFARVYTPVVIAVAAGVALLPPLIGWLAGVGAFAQLFRVWFYQALVLLVIACPCALVISTPVSIVSAITSAARLGVLIKGGAHLEALGALKVMAFDKTGTLTLGRPQVVGVGCAGHRQGSLWQDCPDCLQVLADAAAIERHSTHPLAHAVLQEAKTRELASRLPEAEAVTAVTGRGVRGLVNGRAITVASHAHIHATDPEPGHHGPLCEAIDDAQTAGQTVMVVRDDTRGVRGYIAVADAPRPGVPKVMEALKKAGIRRTVMLTGDNQVTAQAVAAAVGVDAYQANLLPEQKVKVVEQLLAEYGQLAMVGDGVNDAPALARATVGIAMGGAGSDTALETADVALMADDLSALPAAVRLGQRTRRIIAQNVAFSLGIKVIFVLLALLGIATLWMAVFADVGASLLVIFNGMRLLSIREA
ncbi:MAG: heavy metal translocating P-type ATPase [Chloroflexota bacterium]